MKSKEKLYQIKLEKVGLEKIKVIRMIREASGKGLAAAKEVRDSLGVIQSGLTMNECIRLEQLFNSIGVIVSITPDKCSKRHNSYFDNNPMPKEEDYLFCYKCGARSVSLMSLFTSQQMINCVCICTKCGCTWNLR